MAEGIIQSDIEQDHTNKSEDMTKENKDTALNVEATPQAVSTGTRPKIIWTPRFMVVFALILVFGLSIESLLTQGWLNDYYTGLWVFQAPVILICICWVALLILTHSSWVRIGSIFGCIWALFMTLNLIVSALHTDLSSRVLVHINAATCIALLGSYICLSTDKTPFSRLDAWFFGLAPIAGSIAVALTYYLTPAYERSLTTIESAIATTAIILSLLVWWIRPTSWKAQPGPTFIFGCVPLILLLLALSGIGFNPTNFFLTNVVLHPISAQLTDETNFFFSQVALLCLLLGIIRVLKYESLKT